MKRWDYIRKMNAEDAGHYFCNGIEDCDECPVHHRCIGGKNGIIAFFNEEIKETEENDGNTV